MCLHGGDIYTEGLLKNKELIDFSSNINPYGVPDIVAKNINQLLEISTKYPDIEYRLLKQSIIDYMKNYYNIDIQKDEIILGNGAIEIIDILIKSVKSISIIVPSFIEYEMIANKYNKNIELVNLNSDMSFNYEAIKNILFKVDSLMIANPNNPTGIVVDKTYFKSILDYCEKNNKKVFIDEAFIEFASNDMSFIKVIRTYKCLFIIRAFTKFFGMPGVRLGYCIGSDKDYIHMLHSQQLSWNINCFAQYAAINSFKDSEYILKSKKWIQDEKLYFINKLSSINFIEKVYNTNCNFVLCKLNTYSANELYTKMLKYNILIRICDNFKGLGNNHIRLAIKSRSLNEILFDKLNYIQEKQ